MRVWLCLALFACSSEPAVPRSAPPAAISVAPSSGSSGSAAPATPARVAPPAKPTPPPQTGPHGAEIVTLAATDDGEAVASVDRLGGIRLWTRLDGSREPVVIQGSAPRAIALGRDGDGFTIGTLDAAGGVQVIQVSAAGATRARHRVTSDQPAREIESTSEGVLVLRADQVIELIAPDGAVRTRLTPEPGDHVDSLVANGDRVLALVLQDKQLHGRWIAIDHAHGVRWGEATGKLPFAPLRAVLSPDGRWLAVSRPRNLHPTLISVATGRAATTPLCVSKGWPNENGGSTNEAELMRGDSAPAPLGFWGNDVVACAVMGSLAWWRTAGVDEETVVGATTVVGLPTLVTPHGLIVGFGASLVLATPSTNRYLGYSLRDVSYLRAGAAGILVNADLHGFLLDDELRERKRIDLGRAGQEWTDVAMLDDRYAILAAPRHEVRAASSQLAVFDGVAQAIHQLLPNQASGGPVRYEATTRLLASTEGPVAVVLRYDPSSHRFGPPIRLASALMTSRLELLDPALTGGVAVLEIDATSDGVLVGEIHTDDLVPGVLVRPRATYRVAGELRAVDRAGRLYMRDGPDGRGTPPAGSAPEGGRGSIDGKDIVIYTRGQAGARLVGIAENSATIVRPNADGSQIAVFLTPRLVLFAADGTQRWDAAHWSSADVTWSASGALLVAFRAAVATVDLSTGALRQRRCGWGFGLAERVPDAGSGAASICDAAER